MNQKSSYAFRLVLGGWLTYLGVSLLYQMYKERPSNMVLISAIAVIFVVVGAVCAIHSLLKILGIRMPKLFRNFKKKTAEKAEEPEVQQFIPTDSNVQPVALTAPEEISPAEDESSESENASDAPENEADNTADAANRPADDADAPQGNAAEPNAEADTSKSDAGEPQDNADVPENDADQPAESADNEEADAAEADAAVEMSEAQEEEKLRTNASDVEILEVTEEEKDDHADELENDYEEK